MRRQQDKKIPKNNKLIPIKNHFKPINKTKVNKK